MSVTYHVTVRDLDTNEVRRWSEVTESVDGLRFLWVDGNWSCDCNRELDFRRAEGEPVEELIGVTHCNELVRFELVRLELEDGRWLRDGDDDWQAAK